MSSWKIAVGSRSFEVEVEERGYGAYQVTLDGTAYPVRVTQADWGVEIGVPGGPAATAPAPAARPVPHIGRPARVAPNVKPVKPKPAPRPAARPTPVAAITGNAITAPMPGRVVRVEVEAGQEVVAGDPVCVLESMKMENMVSAPKDGTIAQVLVEVGSNPNTGMPLATYE